MARNSDTSSEFEGVAAQFAKAKAAKENEEAQGLKGNTREDKATNKQRELQFKVSHGFLVGFLALILLLHLSGIFLFTSGFLLTKLVLDHKSECAAPPITPLEPFGLGNSSAGCWHPKMFDKAIVVVVDALRYDFTVPYIPKTADDTPRHFHNSLPFFYETATQQPNNAFLLPFIADPPTTTLQRLKGLTTGTLPTFIEGGSNFGGTAIEEDNIVAQLRNASKSIVHLGDDTWHSLFPGYFHENLTKPYDSFNVWDLHTVDDGVTEHLFPLLEPESAGSWDVIFGHYLGVDHAGHRYGPDHPAMTAKLQQMDDVFRRVIGLIDDSTLLVVMGDHGMDAKGDHGGESDDEVEAALWMYSKRPVFGRIEPTFVEPPETAKERAVGQIDLVPTLSLLLGMPIPFNNLGRPIDEAFVGPSGKNFKNLAEVNRLSSAQIQRYQEKYATARSLDQSFTLPLLQKWREALMTWAEVVAARRVTVQQWKRVYEEFSGHQSATLAMCRALWARFDLPRMLGGILISTGTLTILAVYARGTQGDVSELTPALLLRGGLGTLLGATLGLVSTFLVEDVSVVHTTVLATSVGGILGAVAAFWLVRRRLTSILPKSFWAWTSLIMTLGLSISFASNSYTIFEDEVLLFFLSSLGVLMLVASLRQKDTKNRTLGAYHAVLFTLFTRLASLSRLCREEQIPFCKSTYYASTTSSTSAPWQLGIPLVLAFVLPSFIASFYKGTNSFLGSARFWIGSALRISLVLIALFWSLDAADDGDWLPMLSKDTLKTIRMGVAQLVFAINIGAGLATFTYSTPLLGISEPPKVSTAQPQGNGGAANGSAHSPATPVAPTTTQQNITILGYSNVHGSRYLLLPLTLLPALMLVQKPMGQSSMGMLTIQILSLLELLEINKLQASPLGPFVLFLLGSFHFFKTGHTATLSSIQWDSAFIPLRTIRYPWSPLIVLLNTFGPQILCALAAPATALWKQQPKKRGLLGDVAKALATHLLFHAALALATTLSAAWLRRHLMLYRVFMPRFLMANLVLLAVDLVALLAALAGVRTSILSVADVFGWS